MSGVGGRPSNTAALKIATGADERSSPARVSAHVALSADPVYSHASPPPDSSGGHRVSSNAQRRRSSAEDAAAKEAEHLEQLRRARVEAYNERLALQRKMGGMGGRPVKSLPGRHGGAAAAVISSSHSRDRTVENAQRSKDDANRAHLERLKQARIEAHNDRVALQRKMRGIGGRPVKSLPTSSEVVEDTQRSRDDADKETQKMRGMDACADDGEPAKSYLEQLRLARMEAFDARQALARKHRGVAPRGEGCASRSSQSQNRSTSQQVLRAKSQRKAEEQARHEKMLSEARKAAFQERLALEAKMRNGGRTPGR